MSGVTRDGWLLLVYRVPSEPTTLRAAVWRRLTSLGAIPPELGRRAALQYRC